MSGKVSAQSPTYPQAEAALLARRAEHIQVGDLLLNVLRATPSAWRPRKGRGRHER